jgi:hypothetical protein
VMPACRAARLTIRAAPCRPIRAPSARRKIRPVEPFPDRQVDRPRGPRGERDGDDLAALPQDRQGPVPPFDTEGVDVGTEGFSRSAAR